MDNLENAFARVLEACNHRVKEGGDYMWDCFGKNSYFLDFEFGDHATATLTFDSKTQAVYEVRVSFEDEREEGYRWIHPEFYKAYEFEAMERGVEKEDDYLTEVNDFDDFIKILTEIADAAEHPEDEEMVDMELEFEDSLLLKLMCIAHERDITFNQLLREVLERALAREETLLDESDSAE